MSQGQVVSIRMYPEDFNALDIANRYVKRVTLSDSSTSELVHIALRWFAQSVLDNDPTLKDDTD